MDGNLTDQEAWQVSQTGKILITVIFATVVLIGIVGNVLVIALVLLVREMRSSVNLCLLSLALSDLIVVVFLPTLPIMYLHQRDESAVGRNFCTFLMSLERGAFVCSVLTFLLVGVERYTVLCYPLKSLGIWTGTRVCLLLVLIWAIAIAASVPYGINTKFEPCGTGNSTKMCCDLYPTTWFIRYVTALTCLGFFLPIPLLVFLYSRMVIMLKQQVPSNDSHHLGGEVARRARSQVIGMLVALLVVFLVCLIPFHVYAMWYTYTYIQNLVSPLEAEVKFTIEWVLRILAYVNHIVNPIVYFLMSANFRQAFRVVFC